MGQLSRLYRYQPPTEYAVANVKAGELWFSPPALFDDPFDCNFRLDTAQPSDADVLAVAKRFSDRLPIDIQKEVRSGVVTQGLKEAILNVTRHAFELRVRVNRADRGACCLSETVDSILLWSLYADRHRGFCLEFDTSFFPFSKAHRVRYFSVRPTVNPLHALLRGTGEEWLDMVLSKAACWEDQKEWRILNRDGGSRSVKYPRESLTGIYFGVETPGEVVDELLTFRTLSSIPCYRMSPHPENFELEPMPCNGTADADGHE